MIRYLQNNVKRNKYESRVNDTHLWSFTELLLVLVTIFYIFSNVFIYYLYLYMK
ncbi:hypothetical protein XBJ2_1810075 [Xenorhabdus bovienii str. Jollieti]|uniref:Uncharacterized protein n=1 Tax=Xenorhabdus bovienii (strain SS-2004) TaxID=406818 RepID=D3V4N0_XENBS|nr:hypothetical protein XBJ1_3491 [Xenorhabdus bovienii SS-2004]CDH28409.1 hypothetical protein XBJ2_1810075 [Xenorhabdus bovienii str. Jollieti]